MEKEALTGGRSRHRRRLLLPAVLVAAALLAAACGDDDDTATDSTTTTAAAGADGTTESTEAEGGGEAADVVAQYSERPTAIDFDTPVEGEIPASGDVYFITCGVEFCELEGEIVKQATDILGWTTTVLSTDGSPQQVQNAWEQVVREQPDGVIYTGTARSQIDTYITQAAANGTSIAACCVTDPPENGLLWVFSTPEDTGALGEIMAAWVVNDAAESGAEGAGALYLDLPDLTILTELGANFESSFAEFCPDCPYEKLDIALADLPSAGDKVVSAIRANPDLKYVVFSSDSAFVGIPAALSAAGLTDVKTFGEGPGPANLDMIAEGLQTGSMAFAAYEAMFGAVDAIVRDKAGDEVPTAFKPPDWILTADNLPATDEFFPIVPDIVEHFTTLWGK